MRRISAAEELSWRKFKYKVLFYVKMIPTGLYRWKVGYPVSIEPDPPLDKIHGCTRSGGLTGLWKEGTTECCLSQSIAELR